MKKFLQRERVGYIIAASTSPIISVVTQSALFERNICNRKWADSSPVSDGGYNIFTQFYLRQNPITIT